VEWKYILQEFCPAKKLADGKAILIDAALQHMHPFALTVNQLGNLNIITTMTGACVHFLN
jgi:hypothetical protein